MVEGFFDPHRKTPDLQKLVAQGQTWQVEKEPRVE